MSRARWEQADFSISFGSQGKFQRRHIDAGVVLGQGVVYHGENLK